MGLVTAPAASRATRHSALADTQFDILVIGGGITGAGVAREAALAGYRTALVERDDYAAGTSSRSSRLVHGGVRYLEHGHLALVFESSRERRLLLQLAPHLVRPLAFTWPVYAGARVPRWKLRAGLMLYDALSLFRNVQRHEALDATALLAAEPALRADGLLGGARYWDAATDDTRLTLATALAAERAGATVTNHLAVVAGLHDRQGRLAGVTVEDALNGNRFDVRAHVMVNATGPWSAATAALSGGAPSSPLLGSVGAHIAVPRGRVGNVSAITIVSPLDGRVMFVLPSGAHTIIGTTERAAKRGPDDIRATEADIAYLLTSVNRVLPHAALERDDVISAWAGIRPLAVAHVSPGGANAASREHAVTRRDDGLVSVTGGKLTTYRAMAADVLQHAVRGVPASHGATQARASRDASSTTPLPGGESRDIVALEREATAVTGDRAVGTRLVQAFGSAWADVWAPTRQDADLAERLVEQLPYTRAELVFAMEREQACTLSDLLVRRTHVAFETRDHGRATARRVAPLVAARLGWSDVRTAHALAEYDADVARLFAVDVA